MTVYVVVDNDVIDPERYAEYLKLITPTVFQYGGRYVIRAGEILHRDSDWSPDRLVVIEFDMRRRYATSKLIVIRGAD